MATTTESRSPTRLRPSDTDFVAIRRLHTQIWAEQRNGKRALIAVATSSKNAAVMFYAITEVYDLPLKEWDED